MSAYGLIVVIAGAQTNNDALAQQASILFFVALGVMLLDWLAGIVWRGVRLMGRQSRLRKETLIASATKPAASTPRRKPSSKSVRMRAGHG